MVPPCSDRVTRVPPYSISRRDGFRIRGCHPLWRHFPEASASHSRRFWAVPVSLIATRGISVDFLSSGYLDISVPRVRLVHLCVQCTIANKLAGFPHSDISGSKSVCRLPEAYRKLQRPSSPSAAKAFTRCACSLDHITQPVGWVTWIVFRRYFFTRGRRPRRHVPSRKRDGCRRCDRRHSRRCLCHRGRRQSDSSQRRTVSPTSSAVVSRPREPAGRILRSLAEASVGCVSHLSKRPRRALEPADTRLHQLRNCETAMGAHPALGCPNSVRRASLPLQASRNGIEFRPSSLCQRFPLIRDQEIVETRSGQGFWWSRGGSNS